MSSLYVSHVFFVSCAGDPSWNQSCNLPSRKQHSIGVRRQAKQDYSHIFSRQQHS